MTRHPRAETSREASLGLWIKRVQEVLAHRSLTEQPFTRLYNLMRTKHLIEVALDRVLTNQGARTAGIDGVTKGDLETDEQKHQFIEELNRDLCHKTYKPQPVRRVYIPKSNGDLRPLGIPTLKDRVVQEMLRLILEPIYEAHFHHHSYGFRPTRSTHHAVARIHTLIGRFRYHWVIEGDIHKCFDRIHHLTLLKILRRRIHDENIIHAIRQMLEAGVMEDEAWHLTDEGTPQGGVISPLLANIYLNELDQFIAAKWEALTETERKRHSYHKTGLRCFIVRYADDFVVLTKGEREEAEKLKAEIAQFLKEQLHLELSDEKTLITAVDQGFDFLGFNIRRYRQTLTLVKPSHKALARFRETVKRRAAIGFQANDAAGIAWLNRYLIGWGNYYSKVSSKRIFQALDHYVWHRVWRTTRRLRRRTGKHRRSFYQAHYIPYRYSVFPRERMARGRNYGTWADAAHTHAYIVTRLFFIPIRYTQLHSQRNPYLPKDQENKSKQNVEMPPHPDDIPDLIASYGMEWRTIRRHVLGRDGYRCTQCGTPVEGNRANVHHITKVWKLNRQQVHLWDNLVTLCPPCHKKTDLAESE